MPYKFAAIRKPGDTDGHLYPLLGPDGETVESEQWDHDYTQLVSKNIVAKDWANGKQTQLFRLHDVPTSVVVTYSRLIILCEHWNKGKRQWGVGLGATAAGLTNVQRHIRESRERDGRLLMGHARYNWISDVGYHPRPNLFANPELRLLLKHKPDPASSQHTISVDIQLPSSADALELAKTIVMRAARFRLDHFDVSDDQREKFSSLSLSPTFPEPVASKFVMCSLPSSYIVSVASALPEK
jgi:hypothetical protein